MIKANKAMRRVKITFVLFFLIATVFSINSATAQNGWNWPDDKKKAEEKNVLYTDALRGEKYKEAAFHLRWLLVNSPDLNPSIYINGIKIYEGLADTEKDAKKQIVFADSALALYDLRIKYFNDEAKVLDRKAYAAYKYWLGRKDKHPDLLQLFKRALELNGNSSLDINCVAFMDFMSRYKKGGGKITDEEILDYYDTIIAILESKGKSDRILKFKEQIDNMLVATIDVDCQFVEQNFGPKFNANPKDLKLAKRVYQLLSSGKCTDSPLYLKSLMAVHEQEPSYGLAKVIGLKSKINGDIEKAIKYYQDAISLTEENTKKADIYMELGDVYEKRGNKVAARDNFLKAVGADPSRKEAYALIGQLYFASYKDCTGDNPVKDRAVFIAAYEMFKRAGNNSLMQNAQAQFPSMEDIFNYNYEVGQAVKVDCWINETVNIQKR
jgi:tetratricopeptide (TPR) repeat protein